MTSSRRKALGCGFIISLIVGAIGLLADVVDLADRFLQSDSQSTAETTIDMSSATDVFSMRYDSSWTYSIEERTESLESQAHDPETDLMTEVFTEKADFYVTLAGDVQIIGIEVTGYSFLTGCDSENSVEHEGRYWYVIDGSRVFQTCSHDDAESLAEEVLQGEEGGTHVPSYVVPLVEGASWPAFPEAADRVDGLYQWHVATVEAVSVPAGDFENCYQLILQTLPDTTIRWVCPGVGVVAQEYHHHGSIHYLRAELLDHK